MRKTIAFGWAAIPLLALALLAGCGEATSSDTTQKEKDWTRVGYGGDVKMIDVNGVQCIIYDDRANAIDCNWEKYNSERDSS